jgi:hypothetical protein
VQDATDLRRSVPFTTVGAATWLVLLALSGLPSVRLSLIDLILVFAPLVVVPLARPLIADVWFPPEPVVYAAALCFALAFVDSAVGIGGTALALPWLGLAVAVAARQLLRITNDRLWALAPIATLGACAFLVVGAFFAVATRAGWVIMGIHEPIVELTGVHFHYAGFATLVLAITMARAVTAIPRITNTVLVLACVAPPMVATGFTWKLAPFQIGGAVAITTAVWSLAAITLRFVVPACTSRSSRVLLVVSSLAITVPMVLAVFWATAQYYGVPALSIPDMARLHGTVNAFGFVTCGLAGWRVRAHND